MTIFTFYLVAIHFTTLAELSSVTLTGPINKLTLITENDLIVTPSTPIGSVVGVLKPIYHRDYPATPVYALLRNYSDSDYFDIDRYNGTLYTRLKIDRPIFNTYTIGVTVTVGSYTRQYTVNVLVKSDKQFINAYTAITPVTFVTSSSAINITLNESNATMSYPPNHTSSSSSTATMADNVNNNSATPLVSTLVITKSSVASFSTSSTIRSHILENTTMEDHVTKIINGKEYCRPELTDRGRFQLKWPTTRIGEVSRIDCSVLNRNDIGLPYEDTLSAGRVSPLSLVSYSVPTGCFLRNKIHWACAAASSHIRPLSTFTKFDFDFQRRTKLSISVKQAAIRSSNNESVRVVKLNSSSEEEKLFITRYCRRKTNGTIIWDEPDFSLCYLHRLKNTEKLITNPELKNKSTTTVKVVKILESVVNESLTNNEIAENMFTIIDYLLNDIRHMNQNSSESLLKLINNYAQNSELSLENSLEIKRANIALYLTIVQINDIPEDGFSYKPQYSIGNNSVTKMKSTNLVVIREATISKEVFRKAGCRVCRLNFVNYRNRLLLNRINQRRNVDLDEISPIISIELSDGYSVDNLSIPVTYEISKNFAYNYTCVYWDEIAINWSEKGLNTWIEENIVKCQSDHLTSFSVLLDPIVTGRDFECEDKILNAFSIFGSAISCAGLIMTIITYVMFWVNFQPQFRFVTVNLSGSLLFMNVSFLFASLYASKQLRDHDNDDDYRNTSSILTCGWLLISLQYFVLTSLCWMFAEAWNMYQMLAVVFVFAIKYHLLRRIFLCWCFPLIVIISANIYVYYYRRYRGCIWFEEYRLVYLSSYFIPSVCIVMANIVLFINICFSLNKKHQITRHRGEIRRTVLIQVRGYALIIMLTGVTWIFSAFMIGELRPIFQYVFAITNSLQGLIIFLTKCVLHSTANDCWKKYLMTAINRKRRLSKMDYSSNDNVRSVNATITSK